MKKWILALASASILFPIAVILVNSISTPVSYPQLLPSILTLKYWNNLLFHNSLLLESVITSIMIGTANGFASGIIGMMTARALVNHNWPGKKWMHQFSAVPLFIPSIALFLGIHIVLMRFRLVNSIAGVILAHMLVTIPYTTNIFVAFFQGIPSDIENVARTLGCPKWTSFRRILLPLLMPGVWLSFVIGFLISFSEYFSTFLIGGGRVMTLAGLMYPFVSNSDTSNGAVLGILFIATNVIVFVVADRISKGKIKIGNYLFGSS